MAPDKVTPIPCIMCVAIVLLGLGSCAEPAPVPPLSPVKSALTNAVTVKFIWFGPVYSKRGVYMKHL